MTPSGVMVLSLAFHLGDRGSIPRRGGVPFWSSKLIQIQVQDQFWTQENVTNTIQAFPDFSHAFEERKFT